MMFLEVSDFPINLYRYSFFLTISLAVNGLYISISNYDNSFKLMFSVVCVK